MTGLAGVVSHSRDVSVSPSEIDELTSVYESLRKAGKHNVVAAGGFARITAFAASGDSVRQHSAESSWVMLSGTPHSANGSNGADLEKIDGQFVWTSYDATRDELTIATDPFGMQALYLAERANKTYISTSALALAKHLRASPSRLGLDVFLRAGYQFGALTNWEGIERLDPGACVCFTARGPQRRIYWRPAVDETVGKLGLVEAANHCREVATDTFRSYLGERPRSWADLTGGYDSRLLTMLLADAGIEFTANTVGGEHDREVTIAAQLASIAGWDWRRFDVPSDWREILPKLIPISVAWGDCHLDALQLAEVLWGHIEKARLHPCLLGGGGGEHFRSYAWQQEFFRGGRSNRVNLDNWVDMIMLKPVSTEVFAQDPTPEVRASLRARMAAYAEPYSSHLNTTQLDILYAYKCTGHFGAYASAASGALRYELPFYFKPVFNAAFSTNYKHRNGHRLMRQMIETLDPRLAAAPTMKGGPAQRPRLTNAHRFLPYYQLIGRKAVTKISERLLSRPLLLPSSASGPVRAAARAALVNTLDEGGPLRAENMRCGPLFKRDELNDLLARAGDPNLTDVAMLGRIITVELALRAVDSAVEQ